MTTHSNIIPFPKVIHNPLQTRTAMSLQSVDLQPWFVDLDAIVLVTARKMNSIVAVPAAFLGKCLHGVSQTEPSKEYYFPQLKKYIYVTALSNSYG